MIQKIVAWYKALAARGFLPSDAFIVQAAHFGVAGLIVAKLNEHGHGTFGVFGMLIWALLKEFVFDRYVEKQTTKENATDFVFYVIGIFVGRCA